MPLWRVAVRVEGAGAASAVADIFEELTGSVSAFETREGRLPEWLVETYAGRPLIDPALDLRLTLAAAAHRSGQVRREQNLAVLTGRNERDEECEGSSSPWNTSVPGSAPGPAAVGFRSVSTPITWGAPL